MPTIPQLPAAEPITAADELPISQNGMTRGVTVGDLLAGLQPTMSISTGSLVGRTSIGTGGPESVAVGTGLKVAGTALTATGIDHAGFPVRAALEVSDEVILNASDGPRRMAVGQLRGLFSAGSNVTIDALGTISTAAGGTAGPQGPAGVQGPAGPTGPAGPQGAAGVAGPVGPAGTVGLAGLTGPAGLVGPTGATGPSGPAGPTGLTGPAGATGPAGPQGVPGATGPIGPAGPAGATGPAGSSVSIASAPVVTSAAAGDLVGLSQGGLDRAIQLQDLLNGRLVTDQPPNAVPLSDTDVFWLGQGTSTMVVGTFERVADYVNSKLPSYPRRRVEEASSAALSMSRHHRAVVTFPNGGTVTVNQFADCGDGFECVIINTSGSATVILGSGIACTGLTTLVPGQAAQVAGIRNTATGQAVYAQTPLSGVAPLIAIGTLPNIQAGTTFAVGGSLLNYTSTPTLKYSDNGGATWSALPTGSTVTQTAFSFVHPGMSASLAQTIVLSDGANAPRSSNGFNVEAATITAPTNAAGGQSLTVSFLLAGMTTAYLVWMNGATEVGGRVPISGTSGAITAPTAAGSYTLAIWDDAATARGTLLVSSSPVSVSAALPETITVATPSATPAAQNISISGTYTNGPPTGLGWSIDGTTFTNVTSPVIGGGAFSFAIPAGAIPPGGPYTLRVRDTGSPSIVGSAPGTFSVESATLGALPSFLANQSSVVTFTLVGIANAYLAWWNGSTDVGTRVTASGSSTSIIAPAPGTYSLRLYDSATGPTVLDSRSGISIVTQTISVVTPVDTAATAAIAVSGTYANTTPTALDWSANNGTSWVPANLPGITSGAFSFSIPAGSIPAGSGYTLLVRDHVSGAQASSPTTFSVYSAVFTATPTGSPGRALTVNFRLVGLSTAYLVWKQGSAELASRIPISGVSTIVTAPTAGGYTLAIYDTAPAGTGIQLAAVVVTLTALGPAADSSLAALGISNPVVMLDASNAQTTFVDAAFSSSQTTNGGVVKGLRDTSGNGYDLYQTGSNAPTLATDVQNSKSGLLFAKSASQFLQQVSPGWVAGLQGGPLTMLVVCKMVSDASSGTPYVAASIANSGNTDAHNAFSVNASTTGSPNIQAARHTTTFGSVKDTGLGATAKSTLLKIVARFDAASNLIHTIVNGRTDISSATTGPYTSSGLASWDSFLLGKQPAGGTPFYFDGYIFEINAWSTFLSDPTKLNNLITYATNKWGS